MVSLLFYWSVQRTGRARTSPMGRALCTHPEVRTRPSFGNGALETMTVTDKENTI